MTTCRTPCRAARMDTPKPSVKHASAVPPHSLREDSSSHELFGVVLAAELTEQTVCGMRAHSPSTGQPSLKIGLVLAKPALAKQAFRRVGCLFCKRLDLLEDSWVLFDVL